MSPREAQDAHFRALRAQRLNPAFICRNCGTDTREGEHGTPTLDADGNGITTRCLVPRMSTLPRLVHYLELKDVPPPESHYKAPRSPRETADAHIKSWREER